MRKMINNKKLIDRNKLPFRKNCEGYFFDGEGNVLAKMMQGFLSFPGGGVEEGETPKDSLIRETFEETGAIVKDLRKVSELKTIWGKDWAKTDKQKNRYEQYKGEDMNFFVGTIERIEELSNKSEDYWQGEKLIPVTEAIRIIESQKPFDETIRAYREVQLRFLREWKEL